MQETQQLNAKLAQFLEKIGPYIEKKINTPQGVTITLKQSAVVDPDKYHEILGYAKDANVKPNLVPPGFLLPLLGSDTEAELVYLYPEDFEDGGPQPRLEIKPDDPATISLFESIKVKGQLHPIIVYPSPLTPSKNRVCEGHRRRMVMFTMLQGKFPGGPGIWAIRKKLTEQEAFEQAFTINYERKDLSAFEIGTFILSLQEKFPQVYASRIHGFSFQETIGKRLGLSHSTVSLILSAYADLKNTTPKLDEEIVAKATKLPERTVREAKKAPEEVKSSVYAAIVKKELSANETKKLVQLVNQESSSLSKEQVEELATEVQVSKSFEIAQDLKEDADRSERKIQRAEQKIIGNAQQYPANLMKEIYGHLASKEAKVSVERAQRYAATVVDLMVQRLSSSDLDLIFAEADKWQ